MDMRAYSLIFTQEEQQPVLENNKILLRKESDNACEYVSLTPNIKRHFGLVGAVTESQENVPNNAADHPDVSCTADQEKFTWSHQSTLFMLDEYKSRFSKFRDPKSKKKTLWEEIALAMRKQGYLVDADSLDRKMRNMKTTYRTISDNNNKKKSTGRGRINWEYYNYFVNMFQEDKTVNLPKTILSSTICSDDSTPELFVDTSYGSTNYLSTPLSSPAATIEQLDVKEGTPTSSSHKSAQISRLDRFRKRQIEVEEEKLKELTKIRESIEDSNRLQKEKI